MSQLKESQHLKIPFKVIKEATENFKTCIGKGGYGRVYKGELLISEQLTTVAVKRLYEQFGQGSKEFLTEIELLKGQKHPNLISLIGYCEDRNEKIIVYEYAERGSLDQYIRHDKTSYTLSWLERLRVCVDIARGLDHLHNHVGKHQAIIHRDIKSANVLLDRDWVAKISDLGLSKLILAGLDRSAVISYACGTPGYCELEYMITGIVKIESDVFSFGMVLLEVLCGRLCTIRDSDGLLLSDYYKKKKLYTIIDPSLRGQMSSDSLLRFLSIAYGCLHEDRKQRHPINRVVKELEEALEIEISLINEDGKKSGLISSDNLQDWISKVSFITLVKRRTNVGKIFGIFDLNRDGGLSRKEVAAFLFVTKPGEEQLSTRVDEVFGLYHKYIDGKKGLTYHGLLQYYDDGHSDLDYDIVPLVSESDDSNSRKNLIWLFQKLKSNEYGDLNGKRIGKPPVRVFSWRRERGLTSGSLLTMDDNDHATRDQPACDSEVLELLSKPDDEVDEQEEAAFWFTSPEDSDAVKPLTIRAMLLYLLIAVLVLLITVVLLKLKYLWFLFLILFNSVNVFLNKRKKDALN